MNKSKLLTYSDKEITMFVIHNFRHLDIEQTLQRIEWIKEGLIDIEGEVNENGIKRRENSRMV